MQRSRVLLVESDPDEARRLLRALAAAGLDARRTATLHEALDELAGGGVGVVLLDLALPDVDAVARLRAAAPEVAVVALGDVDEDELAEEARAAGVQEFLYKGHAEPHVLARVLRHAREVKRLEGAVGAARRTEVLGRLATGIAHEFTNELSAILGFAELATWELEPDHPARAHLDEVREAATRAASLTGNLLAFGATEGFGPRKVDLHDLVAPLERILPGVLGDQVALAFSRDPRPAPVEVDPVQMQQAVLQLALRAREAMPARGRLEIATEVVEGRARLRAGPQAMLTVRDAGTEHGGEPAALDLAESIVKGNGGQLRIEFEPEGTTVRVLLPLAPETGAPTDTVYAEARGVETVLVVETGKAVRGLARRILEECGYRVLAARDAETALDHCRTGAPQLLLADVVLPGGSGSELATLARRLIPGLKVIFMTGYGARAEVPPRAQVVAKPLAPAALARAVRRALDG